MNRSLYKIFIVTSLTLAAACGRRAEVGLPLPNAYPRPNLPDTVLTAVNGIPFHFLANEDAETEFPRKDWLDIKYPTLGATVHVTFSETTPDEITDVKENRMQRLMLNAGERQIDFAEFTNKAGFSILTASAEGAATPFQFLATDDSACVVSGAVYFSSPDAPGAVDSIRPMVKAIRHDLLRALDAFDYR